MEDYAISIPSREAEMHVTGDHHCDPTPSVSYGSSNRSSLSTVSWPKADDMASMRNRKHAAKAMLKGLKDLCGQGQQG